MFIGSKAASLILHSQHGHERLLRHQLLLDEQQA